MEASDRRWAPIHAVGERGHGSRLHQEEVIAREGPLNVLGFAEVLCCSPDPLGHRDGLAGADSFGRRAAAARDPFSNDPLLGGRLARNQALSQTAYGADHDLRAVARDWVRS